MGRSLYKNIQRFIVFQLTINFVALLIVLLGSIVGTELPLTVTQMLWVNLIMDTFAALALASIPPSESVMNDKPRRSTDFIISKAMQHNIFGVGTLFLVVLMAMIYYFTNADGGMTVQRLTIFHLLCNASVLESVQRPCVWHYRFSIQGSYEVVRNGIDCTGHPGWAVSYSAVRWSCIPYRTARLANMAYHHRFFFSRLVDWRIDSLG